MTIIKKDLINIIIKNQKQLKDYMKQFLLEHYDNDKVYDRDGFILAIGNLPITLVAHLDTVHQEQVTLNNIVISEDLTISSPVGIGGDDRNGVFIIHDLIKDGYRPHVLLTEDEEIGLLGAHKFIDNKGLHKLIANSKYLIQLDRKGFNEAVFYDCHNKEFQDYILSFGFKKEMGTNTDIKTIGPALDTASVNLSCGYYNAHTVDETIKYKEVILIKDKVIELLNDVGNIGKYKHYIKKIKPNNKKQVAFKNSDLIYIKSPIFYDRDYDLSRKYKFTNEYVFFLITKILSSKKEIDATTLFELLEKEYGFGLNRFRFNKYINTFSNHKFEFITIDEKFIEAYSKLDIIDTKMKQNNELSKEKLNYLLLDTIYDGSFYYRYSAPLLFSLDKKKTNFPQEYYLFKYFIFFS